MKRSRALWDYACRPDQTMQDRVRNWARVLLYELQPVRFPEATDATSLQGWLVRLVSWGNQIRTDVAPAVLNRTKIIVKESTWRQRGILVGVVLLYYIVKWVHEALHAGPFMLMIVALIAIFTIGLGDTAGDGLSAYSVFNRGFQRLLGSIDEHALVAQHVGGAGMMMMGLNQNNPNDDRNVRDDDNGPRARRQHQRVLLEAAGDDGAGEDGDQQQRPQRARRSRKKARRGDLEQRRELQRQRQAAMAMGFGGNEQADIAAMNRLLDQDVLAAEHAREED